ncbi:hypothetical protein [Halorussus caseinilyticus]|uniref:Uncharacterized protein n=1 Tax=Halorussus caseinilyticus TaxID=3034025 RepID=A0ABD5WMN1_9EURY|nr:hypothetical protein [Halorussus sp. DT72]
MTESTQTSGPIEFIVRTSRDTGRFIIGYVILSAFSLYSLYQVGPLWGGLGLATIFGFAILMSQDYVENENEGDFEDLALWKQLLIGGTMFIYVNATILFSGAIGGALIRQGLVPVALLFALLYPAWDKAMIQRGIPLSVGGLAVDLIFILLFISGLSSAAREMISSSLNNPIVTFTDSFHIGKKRSKRLN